MPVTGASDRIEDRNMTEAALGYSESDEQAVLDTIARWVEREVKPRAAALEHEDI